MVQKQKIYILTIVSVCSCGEDIHSYPFKTKKEAQKAMKSQYRQDKKEIDSKTRFSAIDNDSYTIYEKDNFGENHISAEIIPTEL